MAHHFHYANYLLFNNLKANLTHKNITNQAGQLHYFKLNW